MVQSVLLMLVTTKALQDPEATSIFSKPLFAARLSAAAQQALESNLAKAKAEWEADPKNVDKFVWVGRRIAYLGQFREAIKWFRSGMDLKLEGTNVQTKLVRHLGHRYISIRLFDEADAIFGKYEDGLTKEKDEVEPDGLPNARNTPIGTVFSNYRYHHGLAKFLKGDFSGALKVYASDLHALTPSSPVAGGGAPQAGAADRFVSVAYWRALCYAKLGKRRELEKLLASVATDLDIIENQSYHRLLLYFKGEIAEKELLEKATAGNDRPTIGYGIAAWRLYKGRKDEAVALLREVLKGDASFAFGFIAAEAELKRLGLRP
jgi:tetratricopeptide (TPR) repeat protein